MNKPEIQSVTITPNPAQAKASLSVVVEVEDKEIVFSSAFYYASKSGEIYTGEDGII